MARSPGPGSVQPKPVSAARQRANRDNARHSTGPRTALGKERASRNALRFGLSLSVLADTALASRAEALAQHIAGPNASPARLACARRIAEAQTDLERIRSIKLELIQPLLSLVTPADDGGATLSSPAADVEVAGSSRSHRIGERGFEQTISQEAPSLEDLARNYPVVADAVERAERRARLKALPLRTLHGILDRTLRCPDDPRFDYVFDAQLEQWEAASYALVGAGLNEVFAARQTGAGRALGATSQDAQRTLAQLTLELDGLARYERRAWSRRKRAMRDFDELEAEAC